MFPNLHHLVIRKLLVRVQCSRAHSRGNYKFFSNISENICQLIPSFSLLIQKSLLWNMILTTVVIQLINKVTKKRWRSKNVHVFSLFDGESRDGGENMQSHKPLPIYSFLRTFSTHTRPRLINREFLAVVFFRRCCQVRPASRLGQIVVYTPVVVWTGRMRPTTVDSKTYLTYFETAVTRIMINFLCKLYF